MTRLAIIIGGLLFFFGGTTVQSAPVPLPADYAKYFEENLDKPLPPLKELQDKLKKQHTLYDPRYDYGWNIGTVFDHVFGMTIQNYGQSEVRLRDKKEEALLGMLELLPPEYYQYIGPYLHASPGISPKILNMPGIKETKNKFPTRIAPQLKDVPDLEFLSPYMYFLLMPEAWPGNLDHLEYPRRVQTTPKINSEQKIFKIIEKIVSPDDFIVGTVPASTITRSDMRTIIPDKTTLLTSADVKAFIRTLDKVNEFGHRGNNQLRLFNSGPLLTLYEQEQGTALPVNTLKDVVNPCQRLVQKIRLLGMEKEFQIVIGGDGFDVKGWAYTCDKTIKAYRLSEMSSEMLLSLKNYQQGIYGSDLYKFNPKNAETQLAIMQGIIEMYKAPLSDVIEVRKNRPELRRKFLELNNMLVVNPISNPN